MISSVSRYDLSDATVTTIASCPSASRRYTRALFPTLLPDLQTLTMQKCAAIAAAEYFFEEWAEVDNIVPAVLVLTWF